MQRSADTPIACAVQRIEEASLRLDIQSMLDDMRFSCGDEERWLLQRIEEASLGLDMLSVLDEKRVSCAHEERCLLQGQRTSFVCTGAALPCPEVPDQHTAAQQGQPFTQRETVSWTPGLSFQGGAPKSKTQNHPQFDRVTPNSSNDLNMKKPTKERMRKGTSV